MDKYSRSIAVVLAFIVTSCARGNPVPGTATEVGTATLTLTPTDTVSNGLQLITPMATASPTPAVTATSITNPAEFELLDWREPTEVITPENMNRVEKIGELVFGEGIYNTLWSHDGSKLGIDAVNTSYVLDAINFTKLFAFDGNGMAFSYDGLKMLLGSGEIDLATGSVINKLNFSFYQGNFNKTEFSANGDYVALSTTSEMQIYALTNKIKSGVFSRRDVYPLSLSIGPDSKTIAVNYRWEDFIELWNAYLRVPIRILKMKGISNRQEAQFVGNSLFTIGYGQWDNQQYQFLQEWDYQKGNPLSVELLPFVNVEGLSMNISPISPIAVLGANNGVYLIPIHDCKPIQIGVIENAKWVVDTTFRPDGKLIATIANQSIARGNIVDLWGIPASGTNSSTNSATPVTTVGPSTCPNIPMIPEFPTPTHDWFAY